MIGTKSCCAIIYSCCLAILHECISTVAYGSTKRNIDLKRRNGAFEAEASPNISIDNRFKRNLIGEYENCWVQYGDDLDGDMEWDSFGSSVDLSSVIVNNSLRNVTLAVGAFGHATIFNYTFSDGNIYEGNWTQLGDKIMGQEQYNEFGKSISLSSNGRIVATGAPFHNVNGSSFVGHVRVYGYDTESGNAPSWNQLGQDINGYIVGEQFGNAVDLSGDGRTIIIGTNYGGLDPPITRIFRYNETANTWNLTGGEIEGIVSEKSSKSTSISHDGNIVAIGTPHGGATRIFQLVNSDEDSATFTGNWVQMGNDINGEIIKDESGVSVSLSFNGLMVAIGADRNNGSNGRASGHARIYSFNSVTDQWEQVGQDIDGEYATDFSGSYVSLSDDGLTVAVGAWSNDDNGANAGHVRIYRFESNEWKMYGHDIDGATSGDAAGGSLSLSPDGQMVAIGSRGHARNSGHVRVFLNTNEACNITSPPSLQPSLTLSQSPSSVVSGKPSLSQSPSQFPSPLESENPSESPSESPSVSFTTLSPVNAGSDRETSDASTTKLLTVNVFPFLMGVGFMLM